MRYFIACILFLITLSSFSQQNGTVLDTVFLKAEKLEDKSVGDIINHLIEYCSGPAATIDEVAAKEATRKLLEELVSNAENIEEMEEMLMGKFEETTSEDLIIRYFGYYIYEHLDKWFYEKLIKDLSVPYSWELSPQVSYRPARSPWFQLWGY